LVAAVPISGRNEGAVKAVGAKFGEGSYFLYNRDSPVGGSFSGILAVAYFLNLKNICTIDSGS
jgi:hypothetical protein